MLNKPLQIGITGGIGSGKSTICKVFACFGVPIYDADSRAKAIMVSDSVLIGGIKNNFGADSYFKDGSLNRQYIANAVFNNEEKLALLNQLVHPRVALDYDNWVVQQYGEDYIVKEAALMFESGSHKKLDKVISVSAPESLRLQRLLVRDPQRGEKQIRGIMARQMTEEERNQRADYIIKNDETCFVTKQVSSLHQLFVSTNVA